MLYSFTVSGFEADQAILQDEAGELLLWPRTKLPADLSLGAKIYFSVHPQKDLVDHDPQLAKNILNEILKIS